ncbi:MAG: GlsB/YeaQ/YmgE family stress response membrane protein [Saprospiraceae bacterium]|nr:GlsB/YeaQ/YmgE family stress response membrane protein [Saprospiraceae bacterium]
MSFLYFIVLGAIAGWLAGKIMKGKGFGIVMNIILGIIGAIVGGWLFDILGIYTKAGLGGSLITATVGAIAILGISRIFK